MRRSRPPRTAAGPNQQRYQDVNAARAPGPATPGQPVWLAHQERRMESLITGVHAVVVPAWPEWELWDVQRERGINGAAGRDAGWTTDLDLGLGRYLLRVAVRGR